MRGFRIIGENQLPLICQRDVNVPDGTLENCVICYASFNERYPRGCIRLFFALLLSDFRGHIDCRVGGWPDLEGGGLALAGVPFAFKACFFKEMEKKGYKRVLWLDASILPVVSVNKIFDIISEKGVFVQKNSHLLDPPFMTPELAADFGLDFEEACQLLSCSAAILGVDLTNERAARLVDTWHAYACHPTAFYSSRSDQTALSILLYRFGFTDWLPGSILGEPGSSQGCLFIMDRKYVKD